MFHVHSMQWLLELWASAPATPFKTLRLAPAVPPSYTAQLVWALLVTTALFILVCFVRRYAAARATGRPIFGSMLSVVLPQRRKATGGFVDTPEQGVAADPREQNKANGYPTVTKVRGLLVGSDNRLSTSKTTAFLWTAVLIFMLLALALVFGLDRPKWETLIHTISPLYLVLLGGPFAAAVLAAGIVGSAVDAGTAQKSKAAAPKLADVFSDDEGSTDLVDTQYILFNLLVAGIVVAQFWHAPGSGAPPMPDFLAILTGGSAATYVANKGATTGSNSPSIDRIVPPTARIGSYVTILGSNFLAQGDTKNPSVFIDGFPVTAVSDATADRVDAQIPLAVAFDASTVALRTPSGAEATVTNKLTVVRDGVSVTSPASETKKAGDRLKLTGSGFFAAGDVSPDGTPFVGRASASVFLIDKNQPEAPRQECQPYDADPQTDSKLSVTIPAPLDLGEYEVRLTRSGQDFPTGVTITIGP
jgi:hypothetical protein